jgi:glycosyltransferase involved in cell wall biosynthesis
LTQADISIVIPAAGAPDVFQECLSALFKGNRSPLEVLVIDDAMDSKAYEIARQFPVRLLKNPGKGVSAARNFGASQAKASILLFADTDVILPPNALELIENALKTETIGGVIAIQSAKLRLTDFFSRYKNHWMRFTYHRLKGSVHLFYTSCAAISRNIFLKSDGFDENYRLPSIEDTAFGAALGRQNIAICILPALEVEHVKSYSIRTILRTDFQRSASLVRYVMRNWAGKNRSGIRQTSVPKRFMLSTVIMGLSLLSLFLTFHWGVKACMIFGFGCFAVTIINFSFLKYLSKEENLFYALKAAAFIPFDLCWVLAGIFCGGLSFCLGRRY